MPAPGPSITVGERDALRSAVGATRDDAMILQVGRMDPLKGHETHIRALGALKDVPGWVCAMVGGAQRPEEEEYQAGLQRLAQEVGVGGRIRFLGERRDVPRLMQAADVFCQPNAWSEGLSIVWMEAFQVGLPIIAAANGTAQEFVGDGGILVPANDVPELARALERVVRNPSVRRAMGARGRTRVYALCDQERQLQMLFEFLSGVVNRRPE